MKVFLLFLVSKKVQEGLESRSPVLVFTKKGSCKQPCMAKGKHLNFLNYCCCFFSHCTKRSNFFSRKWTPLNARWFMVSWGKKINHQNRLSFPISLWQLALVLRGHSCRVSRTIWLSKGLRHFFPYAKRIWLICKWGNLGCNFQQLFANCQNCGKLQMWRENERANNASYLDGSCWSPWFPQSLGT